MSQDSNRSVSPASRVRWLLAALLLAGAALPATAATVFINEIHYDNTGTDVGEAIEIAGPAGTDLTGWSLVLYNGANGLSYGTTALSGTIPAQQSGFGTVAVSYPTNGIQNGSPDGVALVDASSTVVQFLSYEGAFTALDGPASGMTSSDIGVAEDSSTPVGDSLQLTGTGTTSDDFVWASSMPETFGAVNTGQTFDSGAPAVVISEIRIDQPGGDDDEFFELAGAAGTALDGLTYLVIGDGTGGSGVIEHVTDLAGEAIGAGGFFVAAESTFTIGTADLTTSLNFENSDNVTHLLVDGFVGSNGDDLDLDDDGILDVTPWSTLVDLIALIEEENPPAFTEFHYGPPTVGPDGPFVPGHASLCPNGWQVSSFSLGVDDTPGAANLCAPPAVVINEIRIDQPGADNDEYFEIAGDPGTSLDGLTYLVIGDGASAAGSGVIEHVTDLTGSSIPASGFFVAAESTFTLTTADLTTSLNFENSDNVTHLLVAGFTGASGDDLDLDDDGTLDVTPWTALVDLIALIEEDNPPLFTEFHYGPPTVGPDGSFVPGHAFLCPGGWEIGGFTLGTDDTPGAANACPIVVPDVNINEIRIDQPGSDNDEYFELAGDPGTSLDGLTYLVIGDGSGGDGTIEEVTDLTGNAIGASGFFVAAESSFTLGTADLTTSLNFENSDNVTHLLVAGFTGSNGDDLDTNDDGTLDVTPWAAVVDLIALIEEENPPSGTEFHYGPPTVGPDGDFVPGHAVFCPTGWEVAEFTLGVDDTPGATNLCPAPNLFINEVDADTPGSDMEEFVEIFDGGAGGRPLDGLVVVFYNGSGDTSYAAFDLDGFTTDGAGFFVLGNAAVSPDLVFAGNGLQNGADAVALYVGNDTDFPNGTAVTTVNLVDALVYDTDDADDAGLLVLLNAGQPQVDEDGAGDKDNDSNQRCPNGFGGQRNTDAYVQAAPTPGALNGCPPLEIFEIQTDGAASPFDGFVVNTADNAVTCLAPNGFFMQTPTSRTDGDVDTSDGIFVFTGGAPGVAVGDRVDVTGTVDEFFGLTEITGGATVTVVGTGAVPAPVIFNAAVPSPDPAFPSCAIEYECYENMLVEMEGTVAASNQEFGSDPFAEIHVVAGTDRAFREPGIEFPGIVGFPVWDGNPEVFELDPDKLGLPNPIIFAGSTFSAKGVLGFEFNHYELWPNELTVDFASLPVPVRAAGPNELTVGSLNLFRLFEGDTLALGKLSAYVRDVLRSPDILAVQEVENLDVLEDLAAEILADSAGAVDYTAHLIEGNDIGGIDVGFLTLPEIGVDAVTQLGAAETYTNPITGEEDILHDRPPLLLEGTCDGTFPIAVMALHNRSLGGIDDPVDGVRVRQKRFKQAESIAQKVQDIQTADPEVNLVVAGDFNAFEFTDGYADVAGIIKGDFDPFDSLVCSTNVCTDLVDPDLNDRVLELEAAERYSFIFRDSFNPVRSRGDAQILDHAMTSEHLEGLVTGLEFGRGNADAAEELVEDGGTIAAEELRASDHDGLVLYIFKDEDKDGVPDADDVCLGTDIPEGVPTQGLGVNRFALTDGDTIFDTVSPPGGGNGPGLVFTTEDTAGCSCEQIIAAQGLGAGHVKFGCSISAMQDWIALVNP